MKHRQPGGQLPLQVAGTPEQTGGVAQPQPEPAGPNDSTTQIWPAGHEPLHVGAVKPHAVGMVVLVVLLVVGGPT